MKRVLIAGLGNIFYGDDAFGCEVAKALWAQELAPNVVVRDFGIRGIDLAFEMADNYDLIILVDSVVLGLAPGTVSVLEASAIGEIELPTHDLTPNRAIQLARTLGGATENILLVGCEPANLEFSDEMSPEVTNAVHQAVDQILKLAKKYGESETNIDTLAERRT